MSCHGAVVAVWMTNRTATPSVPCSVQQSGSRQASPCHSVVKPTYFWPTTTFRTLDKPCHHVVFNAVITLSHHMAKISEVCEIKHDSAVVCQCLQVSSRSFLMHLFSKAWIYCPSFFFNVPASHPCVATCQSNAFISHNLVAVLTDLFCSLPSTNIRVMVIVWRLRGTIIRTALCWIV